MPGKNKTLGGGGLHHVAMKAVDFDKTVDFYTKVLGCMPMVAWGEGDGRAVMLDTGDGSCVEVFAGAKSPAPEGTWMHIALNCSDPDAATERARKAGCEVTMEPTSLTIPSKPLTDVRIAFCKGPNGEIIEFFKRV